MRDWTGRSVRTSRFDFSSYSSASSLFLGMDDWSSQSWVSLLLCQRAEGSNPAISDFENGLFQITFVVSHLDAMQPSFTEVTSISSATV